MTSIPSAGSVSQPSEPVEWSAYQGFLNFSVIRSLSPIAR